MLSNPDLSDSTTPAGIGVLVVDDDEAIRALWKHMLIQSIPGVKATDAHDGLEAVRLAREVKPDVIVMDVAMPRLDGFAATRQLKDDAATAGIPVIAITGSVLSSRLAFESGCDGYLVKPISQEQLFQEIARVLSARR